MSEFKIKHRIFEKVKDLTSESFLATYKGKTYEILMFDYKTEAGDALMYSLTRIKSAGIKAPKLFWIDKKAGYAVREYLEGETVMEYIARENLPEDFYKQIFLNEYLAKINKMTLNYEPDKWLIVNGTLYYTLPQFINYNEEKDLVKKYIRLWFDTRELVQFLNNNGLSFDKSRLKDELVTNKEIVLMVCKFYK